MRLVTVPARMLLFSEFRTLRRNNSLLLLFFSGVALPRKMSQLARRTEQLGSAPPTVDSSPLRSSDQARFLTSQSSVRRRLCYGHS